MKIIYDRVTGAMYATVINEGDIDPAVMDVEVPAGKALAKIEVKDGAATAVCVDVENNVIDIVKLEKELTDIQMAIAELYEAQG